MIELWVYWLEMRAHSIYCPCQPDLDLEIISPRVFPVYLAAIRPGHHGRGAGEST